jgi:hypothetical protein
MEHIGIFTEDMNKLEGQRASLMIQDALQTPSFLDRAAAILGLS